jgi:hypothetical protein
MSITHHISNQGTDHLVSHMSSSAKEVLIKSVARAILAYTMGVFKLPTIDEMTQLIRYFW